MTLLYHYANSSGRRFLSVARFNCYIHRAMAIFVVVQFTVTTKAALGPLGLYGEKTVG